MSGGSLDYVYNRVEDAGFQVASRATTPMHRAFAAHLQKVAKALHDLEWVWSCDYGKGDEVEAIMAVITPTDVLAQATRDARTAMEDLESALDTATKTPHPKDTEPWVGDDDHAGRPCPPHRGRDAE